MFGLPEVLEFLRNGRRTGTLTCTSGNQICAVYLTDGMITAAASPSCPNLGKLLISQGQATEEQVEAALHDQGGAADSANLLGGLLVEFGYTKPDAVRGALKEQVYYCLRELVEWTEGQFSFDQGRDSVAPSEISLSLDPQAALLDIFRMMDEEAVEMTEDDIELELIE